MPVARRTSHGFTWGALAILMAVGIAYAPALRAPFLFDDEIIGDNPTMLHAWPPWAAFHPPPQTPVSGRPIVNYSLALNYALNQRLGIDQRPDPDGPDKTISYRLVNLLLHVACGALLLGVLRRTFRAQRYSEQWAAWADPASLVIAGVWLLHPIQTEAVDYVIQRTEIIVSLCYVGTLYASIRAWDASARASRLVWYATAVIACLLGMGSKEVMVSAPAAVLLYDRAFRWRAWRDVAHGGRAIFYVLLLATVGWLLALMASGPRSDTVGFSGGLTWYQYFYTQAWAVLHYVRLIVWPSGLTLDYGLRPIRGLGGLPGLFVLSAFGVATVIAWIRVDRWGWFGFLGAWFFMLLAPSSSFVPINTEVVAERRIYMASASVLVLAVIAVTTVYRRVVNGKAGARASRGSAAVAIGRHWRWVAAVVMAGLMTLTFNRSQLYADDVAMWRDVVAKAPDNPRGYENLAAVLGARSPQQLDEAEQVLREGIAADSLYPPVWDKLAAMEISQGHVNQARSLLQRALAIDPNYARSLRRLGNLLVQLGKADSAAAYLERAAARTPRVQVYADLANAYVHAHRPDDAIRALRSAIALDPGRTDILQYLGGLLIESGRTEDAVGYLERAVEGEPASGVSVGLLSVAYAGSGQPQQAIAAARSAVANADGNASVYVFAGRAALQANDPIDAEEYLTRALQLAPSDTEAAILLAGARAAAKTVRKRAP